MWTETMKIKELFGELERRGMVVVPGLRDREVTGLSIDSRRVRPGDLFAALAGPRSDGHRFAAAAAAAGAAALLVEKGKVDAGASGPVLVETDDVVPPVQQGKGDFASDESGGAGDEDFHTRIVAYVGVAKAAATRWP